MKVSILRFAKALALAAVILPIPAFAVYGLMANSLAPVQLAAEHDPVRTGFGTVAPSANDDAVGNFVFTVRPTGSPP